jgi:hypothetical protein
MFYLREKAMMNKSGMIRILSFTLTACAFLLASGVSTEVSAQRDPFAKPGASAPRTGTGGSQQGVRTPGEKPKPPAPAPVGVPSIQDRIEYYKRLRESAAAQDMPIPKVTSVLTLDEMSVTGIFRTPRGYAAMVEAKPIKLSYTIYPGEKFFDGQLVAIEENKLVFRKVTKWTNGKFVTSEENKPLRQYTVEQEVQGTAPAEAFAKTENAPAAAQPDNTANGIPQATPSTAVVASPLEEMIKQTAEPAKEAAKADPAKNKKGKAATSPVKKPVKVAKNQDQ